jgi:putative transposase
VHLTLRARAGLPSLRQQRVLASVQDAIAQASGERFRVLHFSLQSNHMHLVVEAEDRDALGGGAHGLGIRLARAINKALSRQGTVWDDRYHTRPLTTPNEVRHGLVYVLMNVHKHEPGRHPAIDPFSSAPWFDGFEDRPPARTSPPTRPPRTWLAATGWRHRRGLLSTSDRPRQHSRPNAPARLTSDRPRQHGRPKAHPRTTAPSAHRI